MNASCATTPAVLHAASDEELACRVQSGCNESFDELANRLQPRLLFVLRRRLQNESDVEDVAQKTLLRAYEKIGLYNPSRKFSPWLFTIAFRLAADHHRRRRIPTEPTGELSTVIADRQPNAETIAIAQEQSNDLWALAEKVLKPDQWTALWLLYGEGQTAQEIAQTLNRTTVSIRVLLYRARKALTPHLKRLAEPAEDEPFGFAAKATPQIARAEL